MARPFLTLNLPAKGLAAGTPVVATYSPDLLRAFKKAVLAEWEHRGHDWGQPVAEAVEVLRTFAPPEGKVVDPFAGSGTTLVAARLLGLFCVSTESSWETYLQARARLEKAEPLGT